MTPTAQRALLASIEAWHKKKEATTPYAVVLGEKGCPLCKQFRRCKDCPIAAATGFEQCRRTPYAKAHTACAAWFEMSCDYFSLSEIEIARSQWRKACDEMIRFMSRLVPRNAWGGRFE